MNTQTSVHCEKPIAPNVPCARKCDIAKSNSVKNPGRPYYSCPLHNFVQWYDRVDLDAAAAAATDVAMGESSSSAGVGGGFSVKHSASHAVPSAGHPVAHRQAWSAAEFANTPNTQRLTHSNERIIGQLTNMAALLEEVLERLKKLEASVAH